MVQGGLTEKQQCVLEEGVQFTPHKIIAPYLSYTDKMLYFEYKQRNNLSVFQKFFRKKIPHSLVTVSKHVLDFNLGGTPCEVNSPIREEIILHNIGDIDTSFCLYTPTLEAVQIKWSPFNGVIKKGKSQKIVIELTFVQPYHLKDYFYIALDKSRQILLVDVESKLSNLDFEIDAKEITLIKRLGHGASGTVWSAMWRGTKVAVKEWPSILMNPNTIVQFKNEVHLISSLRHPNVCMFMAACATSSKIAIVMELMDNGSLYDVLHNSSINLSLPRKIKMASEAVQGLVYLTSMNILHRDLKSLNLLVSRTGAIKIADFGLSISRTDSTLSPSGKAKGTIQWMAPEVATSNMYSEKSDVYSFGVIMWEISTRKDPFEDLRKTEIIEKVLEGYTLPDPKEHMPTIWTKTMRDCMNLNPDLRPSFSDILIRFQELQ